MATLLFRLILMAAGVPEPRAADTPILFVHGNGDSAALWVTTLWRFESNGYDRQALFAIDMPHPAAPARDSEPKVNRSSTHDQMEALREEVERVLDATGSEKLVLVGSSRGGNAIRNYIQNGGGHEKVSLAILCGTPNHGVLARPRGLDREFNGRGHFLTALNQGSEVHPDVDFVTIRSDTNDKYAQPTGEFLGFPGEPTGVGYDSPELRGAKNLVLAGLDHREVAFHARAFREQYRAITGKDPETPRIRSETRPVLDGVVSGYANGEPTNLPLAGARVQVFEVDPETGERQGKARHERVTEENGRWGPFVASPTAFYEFVLSLDGYPTLHTYRSPFPRSSRYVHLRAEPMTTILGEDAGRSKGSVVRISRPRGYFGHGRDRFTIAGEVPDGVNEGVPGTSKALRFFDSADLLSVPCVFNDEPLVVRTYPLAKAHVSTAEFHY